MENRAELLLRALFAGDSFEGGAASSMPQVKGVPLRRVPAGRAFLHRDFPADAVYFLFEGTARVVVNSPDGREAVTDVLEAPHLFGVTETFLRRPTYGATCAATEDCVLAKLPAEEFRGGVQQSPTASALMIRYLAWLAIRNMDKTEMKAIMPPKDILGNYLYLHSVGHALPHTLRGTRKAVGEELHVNLRTLYRYIAQFEAQGYVKLAQGKIVVTAEGFEKLAARYKDIVAG